MHFITRLSSVGLAAAVCVATTVAGAGKFDSQGVYISPYSTTYNYFEGSLYGARFSSDYYQNIGCYTVASGGGQTAYCYATDVTGYTRECGTTDPNMVAIAGRANIASSIIVVFNGQATCTYLSVDANSQNIW
jgi:hypothetical protein